MTQAQDNYDSQDATALRQTAQSRGVQVPDGADENALRQALRDADAQARGTQSSQGQSAQGSQG